MALTDDIVEYKTDEHRRHVVEGGRRGHDTRAAEGNWEIDVLEETHFKLFVQYLLEQWCEDTDKEEEAEAIVELAVRK